MKGLSSLVFPLATTVFLALSGFVCAAPDNSAAACNALVLFDGSQSHSGIPNVDDPEIAGRKVAF